MDRSVLLERTVAAQTRENKGKEHRYKDKDFLKYWNINKLKYKSYNLYIWDEKCGWSASAAGQLTDNGQQPGRRKTKLPLLQVGPPFNFQNHDR